MAYDAKSASKTVTINEEAGLPENWVPVDAPPIIPGRTPNSENSSDGNSRYLQGSLPPGFQHDSSFVGTAYKSPTTPQLSLMPLGINGSPSTNAAISSTANKIAAGLIAAIPPAPVATTGTDVDDGLVHGDAIWETDPAYIYLRDEFLSGNNAPGVTTPISSLGWMLSGNTGNFQASFYTTGIGPLHIGEFSWTNSGTNNSTSNQGIGNISLPLGTQTQPNLVTSTWALLGTPGWRATFIWRFHRSTDGGQFSTGPNFLQKSVYIGFANNIAVPSGGWSRPPIFIGARFDTDATAPAISDATIKLEAVQNALPTGSTIARNNTQGTVVDTGVTPTEDTYYRLDMMCLTAGVVTMSLNGSAPSSFTIPQVTVNAGDAGTDSVSSKNGQASLVFGTTGGNAVNHPFGAGVSILVSGFTAGNNALNGTFTTSQTFISINSNDRLDYALAGTIANNGPGGWSVKGYASLLPIFMYGNDSQAAPVTDTRICIDYFSFVWNPGVGAGTGTPDPTKSRYF